MLDITIWSMLHLALEHDIMETDLKTPNSETRRGIVCPVFLVLEKNPLVAADMIGTLTAEGPCHIIHETSPKDVRGALRDVTRLDVAFLELDVDGLRQSTLAAEINRRGAHIVLTRGEDGYQAAQAAGWGMLIRPFTDQMLRSCLPDARQRPALHCSEC